MPKRSIHVFWWSTSLHRWFYLGSVTKPEEVPLGCEWLAW
jgi:hypothetical protein